MPIDLGSTPSSGISAIAYARLKRHLGINSGQTRVYDVLQQLAQPEEEILNRFNIDVVDIGIFAGINDIIAHIAPPISCVFAIGVFWPKASAFSAKWTMWLGSAAGTLVFAIKTCRAWKPAMFGWIPAFFYETPFMLMAFYLLCFCIALQVRLTWLRPTQAVEDLEKLYWEHPLDALKSAGWPGLVNYKALVAMVVAAMCTLYYFFR